jgi:pimeloyl-ACP methyl ester carboxylesterase
MSAALHIRPRRKKRTTVRASTLKTVGALVRSADVISTPAAGWLLKRLFSSPRRFRRPYREVLFLKSGTAVSLPTRHGLLRGWRWGTGPTILLVHGWEGRGAQLGAFVRSLVMAGFQVLAYDNPAHGESPGRQSPATFFADAIEDIAAREPIFGVVAHSMGALATSMALRRGVAVERLAYLAPAGAPDKGVDMVKSMLDLPDHVLAEMKCQLLSLDPMSWEALSEGAMPPHPIQPLLIVHDFDDQEVPLSFAEGLHGRWPDSDLVVTRGLGHNTILRDPVVVDRVAHYLTDTTREERFQSWPWQAILRGDVPDFET